MQFAETVNTIVARVLEKCDDDSCWIFFFFIDCWLLVFESFRFFICVRVVITRIVVSTSIWIIRFKRLLSRSKRVPPNTRRSIVDLEKRDSRSSSDLDSSRARITTIEWTKFSRVSSTDLDHRSRSFDASTARILLLESQLHSSSSLRAQVLWSKSSRSVFISFRKCYADSTRRSHKDACQTLAVIRWVDFVNDEFSIVSATNDDLDRKNSNSSLIRSFDQECFEMSSLLSNQASSVYIAYNQSQMMLCIRFICCQRSSISTRSEQLSCTSKKRRMIDGAVVINLAQNCSVAWLSYN
jgi:hypothetical protein